MSGLSSLMAQAVEILVERVKEQFDEGVDNLSRAITNITVPHTIGEDRYSENNTDFGFEQLVKVYLYRRVRGYSQRKVIRHLNRHVYLRQRFGFDEKVPRPQTLSNTESTDDPDDEKQGEIRYGYKYATITLVGDNVPIILAVEPVKERSSWEPRGAPSYALADLVDRLLAKAQQFVDIDVVLFDREFYSHAVFNTVDQHGVTYITPKKMYEDDYQNIDDIKEHPSADAAVEHNVTSTDGERRHKLDFLYVSSLEKDGKYAVFATNQRVETDEIKHVANKYRRRWDIENEHKAIKDFMPRTSSMDYRVRFTNFVFATLIYNLWRLTDYLIKRALDLPIRDDPVVGSRTFARVVGNLLREID